MPSIICTTSSKFWWPKVTVFPRFRPRRVRSRPEELALVPSVPRSPSPPDEASTCLPELTELTRRLRRCDIGDASPSPIWRTVSGFVRARWT